MISTLTLIDKQKKHANDGSGGRKHNNANSPGLL